MLTEAYLGKCWPFTASQGLVTGPGVKEEDHKELRNESLDVHFLKPSSSSFPLAVPVIWGRRYGC